MIIWQNEDRSAKIDALTRLVPGKRFQLMSLDHICREYDSTFSTAELEAGYMPDRHFRSFFLYYEGKRLAGELFVFLTGPKSAEITALVDPYHRREGIFTKLFAAAAEELEKYGIEEILFVSEPDCAAAREVCSRLGLEKKYSEMMMELTENEACGSGLTGAESPEDNRVMIEDGPEDNTTGSEDAAADHLIRFEDTEDGLRAFIADPAGKKDIGHADIAFFGNTAFISHVEIDENMRGRGLGKKLVGAVIAKITKTRGGKDGMTANPVIRLQVRSDNIPAVALYEKLGFVTVSRLDYHAAGKGMTKRLQ